MTLNANMPLRAAALAAAFLAAGAQATTVWDEGVNGDFSGDGLVPSFVALAGGANLIIGSTGRDALTGLVDLDYFTVAVPAGFTLDSMLLLPGSSGIGGGAFLGMMAGSLFTVPPDTPTADGLLGWTIYEEGNVGSDLLLAMAVPGLGSSGFDIPLPAGNYTFWVQELSTGNAPYLFELGVSAVPEPATVFSLLAGLALLTAALKRR